MFSVLAFEMNLELLKKKSLITLSDSDFCSIFFYHLIHSKVCQSD